MNRIVRAAAVAAVVSGAPSTLWSIRHGRDPLEASKAAGQLLLPNSKRTLPLLASATVAHAALSMGWTVVIARTLPRGAELAQTALHGAMMGGAIAALDLGAAHVVHHPRLAGIRALPVAPQVADHVAFGIVAALAAGRG
jgi:hypothetical protein